MKIEDYQITYNIGHVTYKIPDYMIEGLEMWINLGVKHGSFLDAILCNDFMRAMDRADTQNAMNIQAYAYFLYNYAPSDCYGSPEKVNAWIEKKGKSKNDNC